MRARTAWKTGYPDGRDGMCTLILLDRIVPGCPVLVAANRDEYLTRPAAPPARMAQGSGGLAFVAPQDLEAGGTWMGLNAPGLFVGLTNRPVEVRARDRRSRGLLVLDALGFDKAAGVASEMREGLEGAYNPFHMLYADGHETFLTCLRADGAETRRLEPGVHVVGNRDADDPDAQKVRRIQREVDQIDPEAPFDRIVSELTRVLRSHADPERPLENTCVHTPEYGTRSSTILASAGEHRGYWYADGPPCETKFHDLTCLLDSLQ